MKMLKEKTCKKCGKIFFPDSPAHSFCGSSKEKSGCAYIHLLETKKKSREKPKYREYIRNYQREYSRRVWESLSDDEKKKKTARLREMRNRYLLNPVSRYYKNRSAAKQRGLEFNITMEEYVSFQNCKCQYCGDNMKVIGLDRVDNNIGYVSGNVVPCCSICNKMKNNMNINDFYKHIERIYNGSKHRK
jgi:hypothetical protein